MSTLYDTRTNSIFLNLNSKSHAVESYDVYKPEIASTLDELKNIWNPPSLYHKKETSFIDGFVECGKRAALPLLLAGLVAGTTSGDFYNIKKETLTVINAVYHHFHENRPYVNSAYDDPYIWLAEAVGLDSIGQLDGALDIVYNKLDDLLLLGQYTKVDHFLKQLVAVNYSPNLLLGILTVTLYASEHLPSRAEFLEKSSAVFEKNNLPVSVYLDGLRFP